MKSEKRKVKNETPQYFLLFNHNFSLFVFHFSLNLKRFRMKKLIFSLIAVMLFMTTTSVLTSCTSSEKKVENAQTKVDNAQEKVADAKDKVADAKDNLTEAQKMANAEAEKVANAAAWKAYKVESEVKIKANDTRIAELKAGMRKAGKSVTALYKENVVILEKKNAAMKARISEYDKSQSNWESFKTEFNHDMDELGTALKDFTVNNK
jgi:chromosome segregation ATPase